MDIGELLYDKLQSANAAYGKLVSAPWPSLSFTERQIFDGAAQLFLAEYGLIAVPPSQAARVNVVPERDWKAALKKYGRHSPGCSPYGLCNCGYAQIEKELGT